MKKTTNVTDRIRAKYQEALRYCRLAEAAAEEARTMEREAIRDGQLPGTALIGMEAESETVQ